MLDAEDMSILYLSARNLEGQLRWTTSVRRRAYFLMVGRETPERLAAVSDLTHSWVCQRMLQADERQDQERGRGRSKEGGRRVDESDGRRWGAMHRDHV